MKHFITVFSFLAVFSSVYAQYNSEILLRQQETYQTKGTFFVEGFPRNGINNQYPVQIGSAYLYPGLSPLEIYIPWPQTIPTAFALLLHTIYNAQFDEQRMEIANQYFQYNGIYSLELLEILSLLSYNTNRLELAKSAYPFVIDKGAFLIVINTFEFISTRNELIEYTRNY